MIKFIFILLFTASSANHVANESGTNCALQNPTNRTAYCIFECIKIIYDRQFCASCSTGARTITVNVNVNIPFVALAEHNFINYDTTSESIKAGQCSGCQTNYADEYDKEKYVATKELKQFLECSRILNAKSDSSNKVNCSVGEIDRLYSEIGERIQNDGWCHGELGIDEHYQQLKKLITNSEHVSETNTNARDIVVEVLTEEQSEDSSTQITISEDDSKIIIIDIRNDETTEVNPQPNTTIQNEESTTQSTTQSMSSTVPTTSTKKPKPTKKKKPKAEEHHYPVSVGIILAAIGVLLVILVILLLVLSVYVNRRKRFQSRTDSCTYVFEKREM